MKNKSLSTADDNNTAAIPRLLTPQMVAEILQIDVATLANWRVKGGCLPFIKIGSSVRYEASKVAVYIENAQRTSTSET